MNHRKKPLFASSEPFGLAPAAGFGFEQHLIQAVLDFANMGLRGASSYEVEALFAPFSRELAVPKGKDGALFGALPRLGWMPSPPWARMNTNPFWRLPHT